MSVSHFPCCFLLSLNQVRFYCILFFYARLAQLVERPLDVRVSHKVSSPVSLLHMKILAIETSCDETAISILEFSKEEDKCKNFVEYYSFTK